MAGRWIAEATRNKGGLHRSLGVAEGKRLTAGQIEAATHSSNPKTRRQASLARTLGRLNRR